MNIICGDICGHSQYNCNFCQSAFHTTRTISVWQLTVSCRIVEKQFSLNCTVSKRVICVGFCVCCSQSVAVKQWGVDRQRWSTLRLIKIQIREGRGRNGNYELCQCGTKATSKQRYNEHCVYTYKLRNLPMTTTTKNLKNICQYGCVILYQKDSTETSDGTGMSDVF